MLRHLMMAPFLAATLTVVGCVPWPGSVSRSPLGPMVPDKWTSFVTDPPSTLPAAGVIDFETLYYSRPNDTRASGSNYWIRFFPNGSVADFYRHVPDQTANLQLNARDGEARPSFAGRYAIVSPKEIRLEWLILREAGGHNFRQQRATLAPDGSLLIRDIDRWFIEPSRYRPIHVGPMKGAPEW